MAKAGREVEKINAMSHPSMANWSADQKKQWAQLTPQQQEQWLAQQNGAAAKKMSGKKTKGRE